jgi:hypothetical protein
MAMIVKWLKALFYLVLLIGCIALIIGWAYLVFIYLPEAFAELKKCWQVMGHFTFVGLSLILVMGASFISYVFFTVWVFFLELLCRAITDIKKSRRRKS